jgi:ribose transport system substrate-binding protein
MTIPLTRRTLLGTAAVATTTGLLTRPSLATGKKFRIALSNSYIGNKWRIEMENVFKAALQMEPYKSQVEGAWFDSGNNVSTESGQVTNLIAERVDAIVIDAASPTSLNGVLNRAAERGILVVSFDNTVTTPRALKVNTDQVKFGATLATWLAKKLNGKGNVIMVTGVAGTSVNEDRNKGAEGIWAKFPGIRVVGHFTGMWDSSTAERNTAAVLPSLPKIDGIWRQGGTDGVLKAFVAANRPLPPTVGEAENGFRKLMIGYMGHKIEGISIGQPPYLSVMALELARRVLNKTYPRTDITISFPVVTNETVKAGVNVFPDLPDNFFDDFADSGPHPVVVFCEKASVDGKPCGPTLKVNLPDS